MIKIGIYLNTLIYCFEFKFYQVKLVSLLRIMMKDQLTDQQQSIQLQTTTIVVSNLPGGVPRRTNEDVQHPSDIQIMQINAVIPSDVAAPDPKVNTLRYYKSYKHIQFLIGNLILIIGLVTSLVCHFLMSTILTISLTIMICIVSYILYLGFACCNNDLIEYFSNISRGVSFQTQYNKIRKLKGIFQLNAKGYHEETLYYNRGLSQLQVSTHRVIQRVYPIKTKDISGQVGKFRVGTKIIFIDFQVNYKFANSFSRNKLNQIYSSFKRRNYYDDQQEFSCNYVIPGLVEKQTFYIGEVDCHYLPWLCIFTLLGLIWPYSMWLESKVERVILPITKIVTI